jgi:sigma-B regulation protein RsbU (phosphoserine phosphatase)
MTNGPASLLVVDDNERTRELLAQCFRTEGFQVLTCADGNRALQQIRTEPFDLILLDLLMPGTDGFGVLKALRTAQDATALPVIILTAFDQSDAVVRALEMGANDYVIKPYDFPVVLARVQTQLALKRAMEHQRQLERNLAQRNEDLEEANRKLTAAYQRMKSDLKAAARIQEAFLPQALPDLPGVRFAWAFHPCEELAGDALNVIPLDPQHIGLYLLDVSGHGVAAALLSVTLSRFLSSPRDLSSLLVRRDKQGPGGQALTPAEVAQALNRRFPWDPATEQFFTILYGVLNVETGIFRYASAGHPGPVHLPHEGEPALLDTASLPIGVGTAVYREHTVHLRPRDRLYLYSDGVTEAQDRTGGLFGQGRLLEALRQGRTASLEESVPTLLDKVRQWCGGAPLEDDVSVLAFEYAGPAP